MSNNRIITKVIAGILAFVLSVSLGGFTNNELLVVEEHELSVAMADGKFDGEGSNLEIGGEGEYKDVDKKKSFNILEIVGDYRMAMVGYLITGCEPLGSDMDAVFNKYPGRENPNYEVKFKTVKQYDDMNRREDISFYNMAMNQGDEHPMYYYEKRMNGYYEYVGEKKGSYALESISSKETVGAEEYVKDVVMVSKFADPNYAGNINKYKYIWVEDTSLKSFGEETTEHKTKVSDAGKEKEIGKRIYVYNHLKNKFVNNELFLCVMCNVVPGLNHSKGAYNGGTAGNGGGARSNGDNVKPNDNYTKIQEWRKDNTVTVITREPSKVTCADVDNAYLIVMTNGVDDDSFKISFGINCYAKNDFSKKKSYSSDNDISGDVMRRIYYHIAVKQDAAMAYAQGNANDAKKFDTNVGRIGCMLFYMKNNNNKIEGESMLGTGRDFFKNILPDYGPCEGSSDREPNNDIGTVNGNKITDYLYVNSEGKLIASGNVVESSGKWPQLADNERKTVWLSGNQDLIDYFGSYYGWTGDDGGYLENYNRSNGSIGSYKNQMFFKETFYLFQYTTSSWGMGGAKDLFSIMSEVKDHPTHYVPGGEKKKAYYLTMNIYNGDSVTPERKGAEGDKYKNKTLYINKYEIDKMASSYKLPIRIRVVTSHPIKSVIVKKKDGTPIYTYSKAAGVLKEGGQLGDLDITDDTEYDANGKPPHITDKDYDKYSLSAEIGLEKSYFSSGTNNTIIVEAVIEPADGEVRTVDDKITIVTRDFFMLN